MTDLSPTLNAAQSASWRDYLEMCKPRVVLLMLLCTLVGMFLATEGMVVKTATERAQKSRRMVMELLLADQPKRGASHDRSAICQFPEYFFLRYDVSTQLRWSTERGFERKSRKCAPTHSAGVSLGLEPFDLRENGESLRGIAVAV